MVIRKSPNTSAVRYETAAKVYVRHSERANSWWFVFLKENLRYGITTLNWYQ